MSKQKEIFIWFGLKKHPKKVFNFMRNNFL